MRVRLLALVGVAIAIYLHSCRHAAAPPPPAALSAKLAAHAEPDRADLVMLRAAMARLRKLDIPAGELRLAGTVVDIQEHPIAGATVTLDHQRTITSGSDGSFAFDELAATDYQISAEKGAAYGEASESLTDATGPLELVVRVGPALVVHVVDRAGTPVLGAKVSLPDHFDAYTDRDGKVSFRAIDYGGYEAIQVTASGYASEQLRPDVGDDPGRTVDQKVVLQSTAPIGGLVVDQDGNPLPDAQVTVSSPAHQWSGMTTTDAQGHWTLLGFGAGNLAMSATTSVDVAVSAPLVPFDGISPRLDLVIHVERGATIGGLVVDSAGKPLADVRVRVAQTASETDDHGRFLMSGIEAGSATIEASNDTLGAPRQTVDVPRGGHVEVRIVMVASSLAGVVTNPSGEPIADVAVYAAAGGVSTFVRTDDSGHFDFNGLAPGDYQVNALLESESVDPSGKLVHTGDRDLVLVLPDASSITGRVVMNGQPVDYFGFRVNPADADKDDSLDPLRTGDGRFTRTGLRAGTVRVTIAGPAFMRKDVENVVLVEGQRLDLGDIEVEPGKSVRGRVVDASGDPIAGAVVAIQNNGDVASTISLNSMSYGSRLTRTDAAGHFELSGITDDAVENQMEIGASNPGLGIAVPRVLAADDFDHDVELVLAATGALSGTITNNKPGLDYFVSVHATDDTRSFLALADSGEFTFPELPPGSYTAQLDSDLVTPPIAFEIGPNQTTSITFVRPASLVTIVFELVGGTCKNGVELKPAGGGNAAWGIVTGSCVDDTHAKVEHVAAGRYDVCDSGCQTIDVAESPSLQTVTFTEQALPESPPSPDPSQAPSPQDPSPDPAPEADPPAAVDEATSTAD